MTEPAEKQGEAGTPGAGGPQESPAPNPTISRRPSVRLNLIISCLFLFGICLLAFKTIPRALTDSADFAVYYCTGRAWDMGENPYYWPYRIISDSKRTIRSNREYYDPIWSQFWKGRLEYYRIDGGAPMDLLDDAMTPPPALPLMGILGLADWPKAKIFWLSINMILLFLSVVGLTRFLGIKLSSQSGLCLLIGTFCLAPVHTCLGLGQLTIVAVACIVWALRWQKTGKNILAGIIMATGLALKPQMAGIFLIWWLLRRNWKVSISSVGILFFLTVVGVLQIDKSMPELKHDNLAWLVTLQANIHQFFSGGRGDFTVQPVGYQFLNLAYPLYLVFGHLEIARAVAWMICLVGVGFLIHFARRPLDTLDELAVIGAIGLLSLLAVYNRLYGAVWLIVPLAWGICQAFKGQRLGMAVCLLCVPFLLPGPSILNYLAAEGYVGKAVSENPLWKIIIVPHQIYLLAAIFCCLIAGLARSAKARLA